MERRKDCMKLWVIVLFVSIATPLFTHCDARITRHYKAKHHPQGITHGRSSAIKVSTKLKSLRHLDLNNPSSDQYDANAPNSLPSFDDIIGSPSPSYMPLNTPPYCVFPPFTPLPPSTTVPTPIVYAQPPPPPPSYSTPMPIQSPPPSIFPSPPQYSPAPPEYVPSPPSFEPSPPECVPSPPEYVPSPPEFVPSPPGSIPSPTVFLPPVVFPPSVVPSPPYRGTGTPLWCVAKPTVPDPMIQEAMNYACGSGADCRSIQPNGSCYSPNKLILHASYAFNSYWQRTKVSRGTCDFGGVAILITKDPSFDGCHFVLN